MAKPPYRSHVVPFSIAGLLTSKHLPPRVSHIHWLTQIYVIIYKAGVARKESNFRDDVNLYFGGTLFGSVAGIATGLQVGRSGARTRVGTTDFSRLHTRPDRPWGPRNLLYNGYRGLFRRVMGPGCGVELQATSSAKVKNG
jgi:hypothetical protein